MTGVRKVFGATMALDRVDLSVRAGEVHALVGENGAGKSTLMKVLSGAYIPDAGEMMLDGEPYAPRGPADGRRAGVAMIYQELSLAPHLTVAENILLGTEPVLGPFVKWRTLRARARSALAAVGRSDLPIDVTVGRLSVAERQIVEIARSMATGCRVLVLDEPTSSLAQEDVERLFALIRRLQATGIAVVYISHFLEEVKEVAETFTVLRDGETVGSGSTSTTSAAEMITMMVGRAVSEMYPHSARCAGEPLLTVTGLAGCTQPVSASFSLHRGEVLGIAGVVGAGRTELLRAIFGLDPVRSGRIKVGVFSGAACPAVRWAQRVGMVSEDRKQEGLALGLSVADNMTLPDLARLGPGPFVWPSRQRTAAAKWIEALPIKCRRPSQPVNDLSGGNQQKVALARLLYADVDVLLLDEPTRGIDAGSKAQIFGLIDRLACGDAAQGHAPRAVLMVSSYLPELIGVCDRIAVMCRGRLSTPQPATELDEHQIMLMATGGVEAA